MQISQYNSGSWIIFDFESLLSPQNLIQSGFSDYIHRRVSLANANFLPKSLFATALFPWSCLFGQCQTFPKSLFAGANGILCFEMPIFSLRCFSRDNAAIPNKFSRSLLPTQICNIIQSPKLYSMSCLSGPCKLSNTIQFPELYSFPCLFLPMLNCNIIQLPELHSISCLFWHHRQIPVFCPTTIAAYPQINVECRQIFWSPGQDLHLPYSLH